MKRIFATTLLLLTWALSSFAQDAVLDNGIVIRNADVQREGRTLTLTMDLDFSELKLKSNRAVLFQPVFKNGEKQEQLQSIGIYGRNRYYYYQRNNKAFEGTQDGLIFQKKELPQTLSYKVELPYQAWMDGAKLYVGDQLIGCCNKVLASATNGSLAGYKLPEPIVFQPHFVYVSPKAEVVKQRSLSATAYIDFPVSQTVIRPEYRRNTAELGKILATIDSVRSDSDITVQYLRLKGFASPESPYANNERLAKGRVEALKNYVSQFSHMPKNIIETAYEPENWEGLRAFVEESDITNKQGILDIIDSSREPDAKEAYLKATYPAEYKYLLDECYPGLRRTDYAIGYEIRTYDNVDEIRQVYATAPEKLSLAEFYLLAQQYKPGSSEFDEIFKTAVSVFPKDQAANLNAANIAMIEGRMKDAGAHLDKAGETFEAQFARGIYNAHMGDYERAVSYLQPLAGEMPEAAEMVAHISEIIRVNELRK